LRAQRSNPEIPASAFGLFAMLKAVFASAAKPSEIAASAFGLLAMTVVERSG
jgi:hypothetical protein